MSVIQDRPNLPPLPRSASLPKPKGILKNTPQHPSANNTHSLQWDEENLALTEINKDSLMKITEPKTPFVRYNAETDTIEGDIPDLDLGYPRSPVEEARSFSPPTSVSTTGADTSGPSSRRTSISSTGGRPGTSSSGRSGSGSRTSSRSTSFNLPNDARNAIRADARSPGEEVEVEEEMDEETAAKHAEFVRHRGRHYSNEAEAMKRAAQMMDEEDDEEEEVPVPPVPPLPSQFNAGEAGVATTQSGSEGAPHDAPSRINGIGHRST